MTKNKFFVVPAESLPTCISMAEQISMGGLCRRSAPTTQRGRKISVLTFEL